MSNFSVLIFGLYLYVVCLLNIYRYAQASESHVILYWLSKRWLVIVHVSIIVCFYCLTMIPLNEQIVSESELKELYRNHSPVIYASIKNRALIGIKTIPVVSCFAAAICIGAFFVICTTCTILSYKSLIQVKSHLTPETYKLFRKLNNALLFEELIYFSCGGIPLCVLGLVFLFYPYYFNIICPFGCLIIYMIPAFSILITIIYIEPYKR